MVGNRLMNIVVYYKDTRLESKHIESIGKAIIDMDLRQGDKFNVLPFNFLKDEDTEYKGSIEDYHDKELTIESIKYTLVESWNSTIRKNVLIFLI